MALKDVVIFMMATTLFLLFLFYWFYPTEEIQLRFSPPDNTNFSLSGNNAMQFYPNMRYSDSKISYKIENCTLKKKDDMLSAFKKIDELTILEFYPVESNEEILVTCDSKAKFEGDFFVAGEGGPTNITKAGTFNVILKGGIMLIRESTCENPNVAIHELFHALGFEHSENKDNIMYEISKCSQQIGNDSIDFINEIYSLPSLPDLVFEKATASINGRYLDVSMIIRNNGFKNSGKATVIVYSGDKKLKEIETEEMEIGSGRQIVFQNILLLKTNVDEISLEIIYNSDELDKGNNLIKLKTSNQ